MAPDQQLNAATPAHKMHWHVLVIHFPISFFVAAFGFQVLHLFTNPVCYEDATNAALIAGTVVLIPTTWTGWRTWKEHYEGARVPLFQRKITIAFVMMGLSLVLAVWRVTFIDSFANTLTSPAHWVYLMGNILLMAGAVAEGYYGGRLNHR